MHDTDSYLKTNYLTASQFAAECSISGSDLAAMINALLIPQPSYVVTQNDKLISQAFGELRAQGTSPGQYFHPGNATWVAIARELVCDIRASEAQQVLKRQFVANFTIALEELNTSMLRLPDSFTSSGHPIPSGLARRTEAAWGHHL